MIVLKLVASIILAILFIYFVFAMISDFQWRQSLVNYPVHLALGVVVTTLCGWGAYSLYPGLTL